MTEAGAMDSLFGQDRADVLVEKLWEQPGWPKDGPKDRQLVAQLISEFPNMDLAEEFSKWRAWMIGNGKDEMVRNRGRFSRVRNWCRNAEQYRRSGGRSYPGRAVGGRAAASFTGGAPSPRDAFEDGARAVDWSSAVPDRLGSESGPGAREVQGW